MEGWETKRLDQIGDIYSGSTPSTTNQDYWDGDIVWVTPNDLSSLNTPYLRTSNKKITKKGLESCSTQLLPAGSITISSRAPIGYVAIPTVEFCTNQGCKSIKLKSDYDSKFMYYNINFHIDKLKKLGEGTTFAEISKAAISSIQIPFPKVKEEQTQVAAILSTIDKAIEQTEAIIAKQRRIKTGLMQDLLTRGIDEHGNIRSEETHKFKDSPLGKIPVEWDTKTFGEIISLYGGKLQTGPFGSQLHAYEYVDEGVPVVMPQDIANSGISTSDIARISERKAKELSRHRMALGDLVFARRGDLSRCASIGANEEGWICGTGCLLMRPPRGKLSSQWGREIYRLHTTQLQVGVQAVGSTMVNLNTNILSSLLIPLPDFEEQRRIEYCLATNESDRAKLLEKHRKLRLLKTGLMQDLLTGKVRVTNLLNLDTAAA